MERPEKRILILSDLIIQIKGYRKELEKQNFRLYFAKSIREAVSMLSDQKFDILVTDITMPGMDLPELYNTAKAGNHGHLPVIMLCSEFNSHLLENGCRYGADDFILLPASGAELAGRIHLQMFRRDETRGASGACGSGSETEENEHMQFELDVLRQRNRKLVSTGKKLLEIEQIRNNLLRVICHELLTPVSAIIGFIGILTEENDEPDERKILETINTAAQKMQLLTDLALTLSQIDHETIPGAMRPAKPGSIIEYAVSDALAKYERKAIRIIEPDPAETSEIIIDPGLIREVIQIFLTNAIHYSPVGGIVHLKLTEAGGNVELEIADAGTGFNKQMLYKIRAFLTGKNFAGRSGWPGLRFAIARFIMDLHQAAIKVENNASGGASVKLIFPVNIAKSDALHQLLSQLN